MAIDPAGPHAIALDGPATIYEASALRDVLRDAAATGEDLLIDLRETGKWDLAGVQLLVSCVRTGRRGGRSIRLSNVPKACAEVAERSGLGDWLRSVSD
ncbi:STAS domain protein [Aquisphaera giovannonii]|uniref:STAS domain protein n=1 Tax=Aquisphaera giovannonii TaxID=406548 RepID=A0A5B9VXU3_9BACT|nr:STAS domain-containing protein [Aquisphaera giovannonii]QEH33153.1 STAS domain protein [Aquisphaera giovannonii]